MKTVRFDPGPTIAIAEVPRPEADSEALVLKVKASALCGSELHAYREPHLLPEHVRNTGHEVVGIVDEAPAGSPYQPGDRVGARIVQGCGRCAFCAQGYETACAHKRIDSGNGHSEYFKLGLQGVHPVPDDCDWPAAAVLTGDGLGVPTRAARRLGDTAGKQVLVLGLGPVGLSNTLVQAWRGARVMGADLSAYRVNLAKQLGAETGCVIEGHNLAHAVADWTDGRGADITLLAVGRAEALHTAVEMTRQQGVLYQVGELEEATINPSYILLRKELHLMGSWYYTSSDWPEMRRMHEAGLPYHKLITHTFPFERAAEAFELFASGESGKVVLTYE